ncbi:MAG: DM13 domain-containing protein [Chitinophagaceae bacterium]
MKKISILLIAVAAISFSACSKTETETVYSNAPVGAATSLKTGTITQQNAPGTPPTSGTMSVIQDSKGNQFVKLDANFTSGFSTGTVAVYFAKTNGEIKAQRNGGTTATNVRALGFVSKAGEQYISLASTGLFTGYSFLVFYCETAEVNFGSAALN